MKVIGLTGGVGCGKSTVAKTIMENFNAAVLIADNIGFELMKPGQSCYRQIVAAFGEQVLNEDGTLDRKGIAAIVFADEKKLAKLNGIVHPSVRAYINHEVEKLRKEGKKDYVFIESAIILECGYQDICDEFWYVTAPLNLRVQRLKESRGYSDAKIEAIRNNQKQDEEFKKQCSVIIENDSDMQKIVSRLKLLLV